MPNQSKMIGCPSLSWLSIGVKKYALSNSPPLIFLFRSNSENPQFPGQSPSLAMFLGLLLLLPALILLHAILRNFYWRRRGIPGPPPRPFIGNLGQLFGSPASTQQLARWTRQYGRVYGIQLGHRHVLVTAEPKMVRQVMVTKYASFQCHLNSPIAGDLATNPLLTVFDVFGMRWKRVRGCLTPFVTAANLREWAPTIWDSVKSSVELLRQGSEQGNRPVELYSHFGELTTDIAARISLGQKGSRQFHSEYSKLSRGAQKRFNANPFELSAWLFQWLGSRVIRPLFLWTGQIRAEPILVLWARLNELVLERRRQREAGERNGQETMPVPVPLIEQILGYESEERATLLAKGEGSTKMQQVERKLVYEEIVMNLMVFILAGFGVANSMSISFLMVATHPEVQSRLRAEIDSICGGEEVPSPEQLDRLEYAHAVQMETLRLFPVASAATPRVASENVQVGDFLVEKGTAVWPDVVSLHRDRAIWGEDADEFWPERWLGQGQIRGSSQLKMAFYGFGDGPRMCLGMRLAMMEERMLMVQLLRAFSLQCCPQTQTSPKLSGHAVAAAESIWVRLVPLGNENRGNGVEKTKREEFVG